MNKERLQRRVHGRSEAKAILDLVDLTHPDAIDAFLDELTSTLKPREAAAAIKAKERQFAEYSSFRLKYGEHAGKPLEDIPREYLQWIADSSAEVLEMVSGYLEATEE